MLLLVVLSLLVLFLMVGTAFVITAKQSEKAAKAANRGTARLSAAAAKGDLLDEVLKQIVRDTNNPHSSLRFHSLLGDMYGNDGFQAQITNVNWAGGTTNVTGGQLLQLEIDTSAGALQYLRDLYGVGLTPDVLLSPVDNAYNGQLLTFTTAGTVASARGVSTRIVGYRPPVAGPPAQPAVLTVMRFNLADGSDLRDLVGGPADLNGARILINGRPFNGTGFGLNQTVTAANQPRLSLYEKIVPTAGTNWPVALMPNARFLDPQYLALTPTTPASPPQSTKDVALTYVMSSAQVAAYTSVQLRTSLSARIGLTGIGGGDESYDAADYQNMALAYIPAIELDAPPRYTLTDTVWPDVASPVPGRLSIQRTPGAPWESIVLPSWHRPELVNYWNATLSGSGGLGADPNLLRKVLMRPTWVDHPKFTGSNPELSQLVAANETAPSATTSDALVNRMIYGPWDVDNDNDGVRDSVWVDVGLPIIAGPNGKLVKPLAALMIVDMDGRLNVNAHGSCDLAFEEDWNGSGTGLRGMTGAPPALAKSKTTDDAPRGSGFGPADISLEAALTPRDFRRLLVGHDFGSGVAFPGRYGFPEETGSGAFIRPGVAGYFDVMSQVGMTGWPQQAAQMSSFGTPPDLRARYGVGVNDLGQPVFEATRQAPSPSDNLAKDSPYEINLSQKTAAGVNGVEGVSSADAPFTVAELERVLRLYDADAGALPPRLNELAAVRSNPERRNLITTDSFDLPTPNFSVPHEITQLLAPKSPRSPRSFAELLEARVRAIQAATTSTYTRFPLPFAANSNQGIELRGIMRRLLAPELANGLRFNLNRPFGNGRDDNDNGVVDEPGEFFDQDGDQKITLAGVEFLDRDNDGNYNAAVDVVITPMWPGFDENNDAGAVTRAMANAATNFQNAMFLDKATEIVPHPTDPVANPNGVVQDVDHRQLFARHLYVLALTLTAEEKFGLPQAQGGEPQRDQEIARRVAQWAVNVVDFRDPDNIMTAFEYDVNPFNGWGETATPPKLDGVPDQQYPLDSLTQLVWGAERPELVMTETLAMHDRRTDDTGSEDVYPPGEQPELMDKEDITKQDRDYDQLVRPRGTLLVELHNPWPGSPSVGADTHRAGPDSNGNRADLGVDLARVHNNNPRTGSPVWRMMIYKRGDPTVPDNRKADSIKAAAWDPDSPDPAKRPTVPPNRSVYFTGIDPEKANASWENDGVAFFNDAAKNPVPPVRPGRFLVVGAGDEKAAGEYVIPIGDRKGARNPNNPNRDRVRRIVLDTNNVSHRVRMSDANDSTVNDPTDMGYQVQAPSEDQAQALPVPIDPAFAGDSNLCITDVAIIDQATDEVTGNPVKRNLTVSEPAEGYPDKFRAATWDPARQEYKATNGFPAIDIPLDGPIGGEEALALQAGIGDIEDGNWPSYLGKRDRAAARWVRYLDEALCTITGSDGPTANNLGASYASIYLQRLANPLMPWNPPVGDPKHRMGEPVNPYLTVDSTAPNLTVFNSRGDDNGEEEDTTPASEVREYLASHERGYTFDKKSPDAKQAMPSVWNEEAPSIEKQRPAAVKTESLPAPPNRFRPGRPALASMNDYWLNALPANTIGFMNHAFHDSTLGGEQRQLVPQKPFEWLTFNNRPFATGNEIMQVPRGKARELLRSFTNGDEQYVGGQPTPPEPAYTTPVGELDANGKLLVDNSKPKPAFAHLENFFYSPPPATPPAAAAARGTVANMYRVLDYVHTPSLFAGTETWLNPGQNQFGAKIDRTDPVAAATDPRLSFQPPFNVVSEFREPGRVNINTMAGEVGGTTPKSAAWAGIMHDASNRHDGPTWEELAKSRGGYGTADDLALDPKVPTLFANPFRSPDAGNLVPELQGAAPGDPYLLMRSSIDCTLLRSITPTLQTAATTPAAPGDEARFIGTAGGAGNEFRDTLRHQYFKYQPISRLSNLVTTRSNVYAVWVTVGFFEVEPAPTMAAFNNANGVTGPALYNKVYPSGYQLAKEDGIDTGEIRRLRGFYMIDRTMPAAFEPGVDHNVENVIRLRRRIE